MDHIGHSGKGDRMAPPGAGRWQTWAPLALLTAIHLLNHLDRRALPAIFPLIQQQWELSDARMGLIATVYTLARALAALPAGWVADRRGRKPVLRLAAVVWSGAALLSGLAGSVWQLLLARAAAGAGDGANGPVDVAYLGDHYAAARRGRALSLYTLGMYAGAALGFAAGALVGEAFGWRWAFFLPGLAGIGGALLLGRLPESQRAAPAPGGFSLRLPRVSRPLLLAIAGGILGSFATTALAAWTPTYVHRIHGLGVAQAGILAAALFLPASMAGALLGGWLGDRLLAHTAQARPLAAGLTLLLGAPAGILALLAPSLPLYAAATFVGTLLLSSHLVPLTVLVQEVTPRHRRATAMAVVLVATQALGGAPATAAVGFFSDLVGLRQALLLPLVAALLGGLLLLGGSGISTAKKVISVTCARRRE